MKLSSKLSFIRAFYECMSLNSFDVFQRKKRNVIGYFDTEDSEDFHTFQKAAKVLREDCIFHAAVGYWFLLRDYVVHNFR